MAGCPIAVSLQYPSNVGSGHKMQRHQGRFRTGAQRAKIGLGVISAIATLFLAPSHLSFRRSLLCFPDGLSDFKFSVSAR